MRNLKLRFVFGFGHPNLPDVNRKCPEILFDFVNQLFQIQY